jgi:hypothetical protein
MGMKNPWPVAAGKAMGAKSVALALDHLCGWAIFA